MANLPGTDDVDGLFAHVTEHNHEQVSIWSDADTGYRGVIAIHSTVLGPALGGTRFWRYASDTEAMRDVLRLSRGMTYKAAVAGLDLGGGKSIIIGDNKTPDREGIFRAHGRHINALGGRYITAEDVGTSPADMEYVNQETQHVVGLAGRSGDPSPVTAFGVFRGIQACVQFRYGSDSLTDKLVLVQGVGHVGYHLCKLLHDAGAKLVASDIDVERVKRVVDEFGATGAAAGDLYGMKAEIFAPCALGAVINDGTVHTLDVDIVAGAANNQLAEDVHGDILHDRDVIYAPDYVINSGGLINVNAEVAGWSLDRSRQKASEIYDAIMGVLEISRDEGIPTYRAADRLAERRIAEAKAKAAVKTRA